MACSTGARLGHRLTATLGLGRGRVVVVRRGGTPVQLTGMFGNGKGNGLGDVKVCGEGRTGRGHDSWK